MQASALTVVKKGDVFKLDEKLLESVLKRPDVADKKVCLSQSGLTSWFRDELSHEGSGVKVHVISIAGAYRKGKSFLMNFLLRYLDHLSRSSEGDWMESKSGSLTGFNWQGGSKGITEGILLWSEPFILRDKEGQEVAVFLMDSQGLYDRDSTVKDCTTIFALSTLLSSVTVYNLKEVIDESNLQQMQMFTEIAQLAMKDHNTEKPFQRLMFLIRDWQCPRERKYGLEGGKDYLDQMLKISPNQHQENREVREYIKSSFEKIECFLMPHPGSIVAEGDFDGNLADITEKFKDHLRVLMPHLLDETNVKSITCAQLFDYFKAYCAMFEGDELPEPKSMVQMLAEAQNEVAEKEARTHYETEMEKLCGDGRPYVANLHTEHKRLKGEAMALFDGTKKIGGSKLSDKYRALLGEGIEKAYEKFEKSNEERARSQNEVAEKKARTHYRSEMKKLCGDGRPYVANLLAEHERLKGEAMDLFDGSKVGDSDKYRASLEKEIKEAYKHFEKSNDLKKTKPVWKAMSDAVGEIVLRPITRLFGDLEN